MALSKKAKTWLIALSIPGVLIVGAVIALKMLFTSERLKAMVIPPMEQATGRTVEIREMSLSVFPSLSVRMDGLSISNIRGEGFSQEPFISLDRLILDVRLVALLRGDLDVTTVLLQRPNVLLEVNKDGVANYRMPPVAEQDTAVRVEVKSERGAFILSDLRIEDGSIALVDHKANSATRLEGLNQRMSMRLDAATKQARIESNASIERLSYGSVSTPLIANLRVTSSQTLVYDMNTDVLTIEAGRAGIQDMVLTITGSIKDVQGTPGVDVVIESDQINIAELLSIAPREYMKKAEGLRGNGIASVRIAISGVVTDSTSPDITGTITARDASIQYAQLPRPITNVNILSDFSRTARKQEFRLTRFSASLGNNPLSGSMEVVNFDDPSMRLSVNAALNLAEIKDYYPLEAGTELSGSLKTDVTISGKVSNPQAIRASGSMSFQNVSMKTAASANPVRNLQGTITFNNQVVEAKRLSMTLGKSDLTLGFWLRNYLSMLSEEKAAPRPAAGLTLTSTRLYTADIMGDKPEEKTASGQARDGRKGGVALPNVDMDISASVGTLTMEKYELTNVRGQLRISGGLITLQSFTGNMLEGAIATKGTLNLTASDRPTFDLAMDMNGVSAGGMLANFTTFGRRLSGKLTMSTTVKGALDDTLGLIPSALNGQGSVQIVQGRLVGVEVNRAIADALKAPDLREVAFNDWANSFSIENGRVLIRDLRIRALDADYVVNGSQGIDGSLDFTMSLFLPERTSAKITLPGVAGQAVAMLKDESGRVKLDFAVTGTADNPKVTLDTQALQRKIEDAAKQRVAEEARKVEDQLKKKAEDAIKGLIKKK